MESEIRLLCIWLCNLVVLDLNTFSLKYCFSRWLPSFPWPQRVKFRSLERSYEDFFVILICLQKLFTQTLPKGMHSVYWAGRITVLAARKKYFS